MPTNRRIFDLLVSHGDLIVDDAVPTVFLDFCAHVQSYEAVLAGWEQSDRSVLFALIDHPVRLFFSMWKSAISPGIETVLR